MPQKSLQVKEPDAGLRIDAHLARVMCQVFSRSQIKKLIEAGGVKVSGREVSAHYHVKGGDQIEVCWGERAQEETRAEDIPIEIIHEDEDLIVVNKSAGMVVHPAHGNKYHTLVNALLFHVKKLSHSKDGIRPGIVHRLDKDTSGVMLVAKSDHTHAFLAQQFKDRNVERFYQVVVRGCVQHDEGICEEPVGRAFLSRKKVIIKPSGGKDAVTYYRVVQRTSTSTLLEVRPITGRTHQIRVHMAHIGHPILGDGLYGIQSRWIDRQAVHASAIRFTHPRTQRKAYYEAPLPEDMKFLLSKIEQGN